MRPDIRLDELPLATSATIRTVDWAALGADGRRLRQLGFDEGVRIEPLHKGPVGADPLAVLDGHVLGKPGSHQKAVEQLLAASGKSVKFLTAVCMLDPVTRKRYEHTDETIVHFREFDRRLAEAYLRLDEPYDCAGSFKLEGAGFLLFESVKTDDPTALIGLPMIWISDRLLELGYLLP